MRALNGSIPPWLAALEEALIAFATVTLVGLAAFGFPPTVEALYVAGITGGVWGLKTWAEARGLQHQPPPGGGP